MKGMLTIYPGIRIILIYYGIYIYFYIYIYYIYLHIFRPNSSLFSLFVFAMENKNIILNCDFKIVSLMMCSTEQLDK